MAKSHRGNAVARDSGIWLLCLSLRAGGFVGACADIVAKLSARDAGNGVIIMRGRRGAHRIAAAASMLFKIAGRRRNHRGASATSTKWHHARFSRRNHQSDSLFVASLCGK